MVKVVISFISGIMVCGLLLIGVRTVLPIQAQTDSSGDPSDNETQGFINLLPDIAKIYRESLTMPFRKAESQIHDKDIAQFYKELMDQTGLRGTESDNTTN